MKLVPVIACLLILVFNSLAVGPADALVNEGRLFLAARDVTNANARFAAALSLSPNHEAANVLHAATRLLTIANKPAGKALLDRFNVSETNRDIYAWTALLPVDTNGVPIPPTNSSPAEIVAFLRTNVLAEIIGAEANLAAVTNPNFTLLLTANETILAKVTIDYADLQMMRAWLKFAQYSIHTVNSWNVDAQFTAIRNLADDPALTAEDWINLFPNLFTFATTNDLAAGRQAFSDAATLYNSASALIRSRPGSLVRLFNYAPEQFNSELTFRTTLNEIKQSLNGPVVLTIDPYLSANFGRHFSGQMPPRAMLPLVKGNALVANTLPDPTFDGLVQGVSRADIDKLLGLKKHLGARVASQFTVPARTPDGRFQMTLNAVDGTLVAIQSSTDLTTWQTLDVLVVTNGAITLLDNMAAATPSRYYRALDLTKDVPSDFRPPNDDFANRPVLTGTSFSVVGCNAGATAQEGEPFGYGEGGSVWWSWTAPKSGIFQIDASGAKYYPTVLIYQGTGLENLEYVGETYGEWPSRTSSTRFEAQEGTTYHFVFVTEEWERGGKVSLSLFEVPPNDYFENRITLTGGTNSVAGSNRTATKQYLWDYYLNEPDHAGNDGGRSLWWEWESPFEAIVTIDTLGSSFDTLLAVYAVSDDGWDYFEEIAANDDDGLKLTSRLSFATGAGVTFFIAVDGYDGDSGDVVLNLKAVVAPPPPNDDFENASVVSGTDIAIVGNNVGATRQPGEQEHPYGGGGRTLWWKWTAPTTGEVYIYADHSRVYPLIAVYTGSAVSNLSAVAAGEYDVWFSTYAGATYYIMADSFYDSAVGDISLNLRNTAAEPYAPYPSSWPASDMVPAGGNVRLESYFDGTLPMQFQWQRNGTNLPGATNSTLILTAATTNDSGTYRLTATNAAGGAAIPPFTLTVLPPAPNDAFVNAIPLLGRTNTIGGNNTVASWESGEPNHAYAGGRKSVWWAWTAPASGVVTIDTIGSDYYYAVLSVYTGNAVNALTPVASDIGGSGGRGSRVTFNAMGGTIYRIAVDAYYGNAGNIVLNVRQP